MTDMEELAVMVNADLASGAYLPNTSPPTDANQSQRDLDTN
jgi:hypothetical protein